MTILKTEQIPYAPKPNVAQWIASNEMPAEELVTSCFGIIRYKGDIILIDHIKRGLEMPGGHKENGETALECFKREMSEECGVSKFTKIEIIAHQKIEIQNPVKPEKYKYPFPISYQVVYYAEAEELDEFKPSLDSRDRYIMKRPYLRETEFYRNYRFLFDLVKA